MYINQIFTSNCNPLVILRVGGVDFLVPVVREAKALDLAAEIVAVLLGGNGRVRTGLNGVLFCGEAESVPTHRVEHVETAAALVAADDVGGGVTFGVAHMEASATRVREHVQAVILGLGLIFARLESLMFFPVGLPLGFDLLRIILSHDLYLGMVLLDERRKTWFDELTNLNERCRRIRQTILPLAGPH